MIGGLAVIALAGGLRGLGPNAAVLFGLTFVMGAGIALIQPAFPPLAAHWFPRRVGFATAVYTNGLLAGELAPAALTAPVVLPLLAGSWELALAAWSLPVLLTSALVALFTPHAGRDEAAPPVRWWPDWRQPEVWLLGLIFGCGSALYWASNAFVPDYLHAHHRTDLVAPALTAINLTQFGASVLTAVFTRQIVGHRWPFIGTGFLVIAAVAGFLLAPGAWAVVFSGLFGFTSATTLVLTLALAPMLAPEDSHRLTAGIFTIAYALAFTSPFLSGATWDLTGRPEAAFLPGFVEGAAIAILALFLSLPKPSPPRAGRRRRPAGDT